jgi:hypothetical protein
VSTLSTIIRRMRPVDLLLPIGAALVSAGLQNLADRETRQRARLDELAELAADHLQALAAAGVPVDELAVDEQHPLDPGVPWLAQHATPVPDEPVDERRSWKLPVLALGSVIGVALWKHREQLAARLGIALGYPYGPDGPVAQDLAAGVNPDLTPAGVNPGLTPQGDEPDVEPVDEPSQTPAEACGWPNCDWTSTPGKTGTGQTTQAAVHRNRCVYRPAGANVSPA